MPRCRLLHYGPRFIGCTAAHLSAAHRTTVAFSTIPGYRRCAFATARAGGATQVRFAVCAAYFCEGFLPRAFARRWTLHPHVHTRRTCFLPAFHTCAPPLRCCSRTASYTVVLAPHLPPSSGTGSLLFPLVFTPPPPHHTPHAYPHHSTHTPVRSAHIGHCRTARAFAHWFSLPVEKEEKGENHSTTYHYAIHSIYVHHTLYTEAHFSPCAHHTQLDCAPHTLCTVIPSHTLHTPDTLFTTFPCCTFTPTIPHIWLHTPHTHVCPCLYTLPIILLRCAVLVINCPYRFGLNTLCMDIPRAWHTFKTPHLVYLVLPRLPARVWTATFCRRPPISPTYPHLRLWFWFCCLPAAAFLAIPPSPALPPAPTLAFCCQPLPLPDDIYTAARRAAAALRSLMILWCLLPSYFHRAFARTVANTHLPVPAPFVLLRLFAVTMRLLPVARGLTTLCFTHAARRAGSR